VNDPRQGRIKKEKGGCPPLILRSDERRGEGGRKGGGREREREGQHTRAPSPENAFLAYRDSSEIESRVAARAHAGINKLARSDEFKSMFRDACARLIDRKIANDLIG
jgi:hypothetical protein